MPNRRRHSDVDGRPDLAGVSLGREAQDGVAVSVFNVDSDIPDKVIEKLKGTKDVLFVKLLKV